jgi:hypothetical protein
MKRSLVISLVIVSILIWARLIFSFGLPPGLMSEKAYDEYRQAGIAKLYQIKDMCGDNPDNCLRAKIMTWLSGQTYVHRLSTGIVMITKDSQADNGFFCI